MNYIKRDFSDRESVALGALQASSLPKRNWAISYRAVAPVAMTVDALIIFATSILSGVAYHIEFVKRLWQPAAIRRALQP